MTKTTCSFALQSLAAGITSPALRFFEAAFDRRRGVGRAARPCA